MTELSSDEIARIEKKIGYQFQNKAHLHEAFTHASALNESADACLTSNERLEFLGDRVVGLAAAAYFFAQSDSQPGELTASFGGKTKTAALCAAAERLGLEQYLITGGSVLSSGVTPEMKEDLFEALSAAILIDSGGFPAAERFVRRHLLETDIDFSAGNHIGRLKELSEKNKKGEPVYVEEESINGFISTVTLCGVSVTGATRCRKRDARQDAARLMLVRLRETETL